MAFTSGKIEKISKREEVMIIRELNREYKLVELLKMVDMPSSVYCFLSVKLLATELFVKMQNAAPTGNKLRFSPETPSFDCRPEKMSYLWLRDRRKNQRSLGSLI